MTSCSRATATRCCRCSPTPSAAEREILGCFATTVNETVLHTDARVLPQSPRARASWNYLLGADAEQPPSVTYDLNRLQGIAGCTTYCVTLNPRRPLDGVKGHPPARVSPPAFTLRVDRRAGTLARGERRQSHPLLRRLLALRLSRGRAWCRRIASPRDARGALVTTEPGLYVGTITHRRYAPRRITFRYSLFMALLDDRPDRRADGGVAPDQLNRWNWSSFYDAIISAMPRCRCASGCARARPPPAARCRTAASSC